MGKGLRITTLEMNNKPKEASQELIYSIYKLVVKPLLRIPAKQILPFPTDQELSRLVHQIINAKQGFSTIQIYKKNAKKGIIYRK